MSDPRESDLDTEVRDQPPKTPPSYAFDYYGNRISEQEDQHLQRQFREQYQQAAAAAALAQYSSNAAVNHSPAQSATQPPPVWSATQPPTPARQMTRDDFSEFLEVPPAATDRSMLHNEKEAEVERGCVAEFGQCMKVSLCCIPADEDLDEVISFLEGNSMLEDPIMTQQQVMMQGINNQLQALRESTVDAKTSKAMLEFELRSELIDIQRQTVEMEESYRREIAREMTEKVLLQAQLQSKLLTIMEGRMVAEIQLDRLTIGSNKQIRGASPSGYRITDGDMIPTAICTPLSQRGDQLSPPVSQRGDNLSPLSVLGEQPSVAPQAAAPATATATATVDHPPMTNSNAARVQIEPPTIQVRMPVDPVGYASPTDLSPSNKENTPFGLSIVVESADNDGTTGSSHPERSVSCGSLASPTAFRSFSPSGPATNRSCDPEGSSFEKVVNDSSQNNNGSGSPSMTNKSPSPSAYTSLPLPVATPVGQWRATSRFEATE